MSMISANRLGAAALIVGPALAFVMYLIQPGGLLNQPTDTSDVTGSIAVWMENGALLRVTAALISLGLMGMAFGIYEVHVAHRGSKGDGLTMAGLGFVTLCVITWILGQGLAPVLAGTAMPAESQAALYFTIVGLIIIGGLAGCAGILLFSIAVIIDSRGRVFLILSWIAALSTVIGAVGWITASGGGSALDSGLTLARSVYLVWVIWLIALGVRLAREEPGS